MTERGSAGKQQNRCSRDHLLIYGSGQVGTMSPNVIVDDNVFEAYLKCETKAYLILNESAADQSEIAKWRQISADVYRDSAYKQLLDVSPKGEVHFGIPPTHALKRGSKYPPAKPGALRDEPLEAAVRG